MNAMCNQALSGLDRQLQIVADISGNAALNSALNTQFLLQIGVFTAVPMIVNFILEQGVLKVSKTFVISPISCIKQLQAIYGIVRFGLFRVNY